MKILITGSSGTGKSTIIKELGRRGFTTYDADDTPGLSELQIKATGKPAEWPTGFVDWNYYAWNWNEERLLSLLASDATVFVGAINSNQKQYYHLFDQLLVLTLNADEHARRLYQRPKRTGGDSDENIRRTISKHKQLTDEFLQAGATPIDASLPVRLLADTLLDILGLQ